VFALISVLFYKQMSFVYIVVLVAVSVFVFKPIFKCHCGCFPFTVLHHTLLMM
jgi:hypothetical protein